MDRTVLCWKGPSRVKGKCSCTYQNVCSALVIHITDEQVRVLHGARYGKSHCHVATCPSLNLVTGRKTAVIVDVMYRFKVK